MDPETPEETTAQDSVIVLRNHPTVILSNLITAAIVIAFVVVINIGNIKPESGEIEIQWWYLLPAIGVFLFITFIFWRRWKLTTFTFNDNEIYVKRDTIFKSEVHIQYPKLASVNVRRNLFHHLFGTTQLLFNVNSSVNSNRAEASITLKSDEADWLRESISSRIFKREMVMEEEKVHETLVQISNFDVILHGLFGQPTVQSIIGLIALAYSIFTLRTGNGAGSIVAIILFLFTTIGPWIRTILRYYNYRIYRVDDTITVESGLISNYRSSFNIKKVNSVRIRQPLLARFMGKAVLEAEVVGLADKEGLPLLCPLKGKDVVLDLSRQLVPEFLFECDRHSQPKMAAVPTVMYKVLLSAVLVAIGAAAFLFMEHNGYEEDFVRYGTYILCAVCAIVLPLLLIIHGLLAQGNREFAMGEETFMMIIGAYDRETDFIRYDKVQISVVSAGPVQRRYGVAQCTVSLMSSAGARNLKSGIFLREELDKVPEEVMARIRDGRYDYRKYL